MINKHQGNYREYAKGLSIGVLEKKQKDMSFKLENEPHKLVDRGKAEMELEIIIDIILENKKNYER